MSKKHEKARRKPRKPKDSCFGWDVFVSLKDIEGKYLAVAEGKYMVPHECRKLAAWLIRAADFLESKKDKP